MAAYVNHVKRQLADGQLALGLVLRQARTVDIAAIAKACGFDWLSIEMEHSSLNIDTAAQMACAALPVGISALVRVPGRAPHHATRLLDTGAQGVIIPHVDSAEEAALVVSHCKFPPVGHRSIASVQPQLAFQSISGADAMQAVNAETLIVVMLETPQAIDNADAIAAVPGIDVLLIGTNDLCAELGIPGQFAEPKVEDAYRRVTAACRKHGVHAGMAGVHDPKLAEKFIGLGVRFVAGGTDLAFMMTGARQRVNALRGLLKT